MIPARNWLVSGRMLGPGPGSNARWLRSRVDVVMIQHEASWEAVTSTKAQGGSGSS